MEWFAIVWSGFVATTVATAFFWLLRSLGWTSFSPTVQIGCLFLRDPRSPLTETVGFFLLLLLGSTLIPAAYSTVLAQWGGATLARGALLGTAHGLLGASLLAPVAGLSASGRAGSQPAPGALGVSLGRITPFGIVLGHSLFGAVTGAVLGAF